MKKEPLSPTAARAVSRSGSRNCAVASSPWLESALQHGDPIPEPGEEASGKFVVRVPKGVHAALARAAEREGVSLASTLAAVVGDRVTPRKADTAVAPKRPAKKIFVG